MKNLLKIVLAVVLTGLVVGVGEYFYLNHDSSGIEMERYENEMYGYSIEIPKSWGSIAPYGNSFADNLYDEMEAIGPLVPSSASCEGCDMSIEVFTDKNSDESWVDFYKRVSLDGNSYQEFAVEDPEYPTTIFTFVDEDSTYLSECWLFENSVGDKAYAFCFSGNDIFRDIMDSVELE